MDKQEGFKAMRQQAVDNLANGDDSPQWAQFGLGGCETPEVEKMLAEIRDRLLGLGVDRKEVFSLYCELDNQVTWRAIQASLAAYAQGLTDGAMMGGGLPGLQALKAAGLALEPSPLLAAFLELAKYQRGHAEEMENKTEEEFRAGQLERLAAQKKDVAD